MTAEGWREVVLRAAEDPRRLDMLVRLLVEADEAKSRLCDEFACIGRPWPDLVNDIMEASVGSRPARPEGSST